MHIYGIEKNGINEPICRAGKETQTLRLGSWDTVWAEEGGKN